MKPIKLIPRDLHRRLFGELPPEPYVEDEEVGGWLSKLPLPPLRSSNGVFDHIAAIGSEQLRPYEELFEVALSMPDRLPRRPPAWTMAVGWTRYHEDGRAVEPVEAPPDDVLFFDIETYSWCSDRLVNLSPVPRIPQLKHMIPLESSDSSPNARLVVGHNVGYDRSRVREQFYRKASPTCFWDTMSMSIACQGMAEHQRLLYEKKDDKETPMWTNHWRNRACKNSLADVYLKFFPDAAYEEVDKSFQSVFVTETIDVIRDQFQLLTDYCANDNGRLLSSKRFFLSSCRCPSPVTSVGMMTMAAAYLPVTSNWRGFYEQSEGKTQTINNTATITLAKTARQLADELQPEEKYKEDPWMWTSDWRAGGRNYPNTPAWFLNIFGNKKLAELPRIFGVCYGSYPLFYKRDMGWGFLGEPAGKSILSPRSSIAFLRSEREELPAVEPVLLRNIGPADLPTAKILELIDRNRQSGAVEVPLPLEQDGAVGSLPFYRLKHPKGEGQNVGSPFSKDFHSLFHDGILWPHRFKEHFEDFLKSGSHTRFWGNYRDRYNEQVVAYYDEQGDFGAIAPSVIPAGTITRRAVHKLWLTSTNPKEEMIGSQLKSMVECPPGWKLVGADVDSQEQWLAAVFGDSLSGSGRVGTTPFSRMQLAGSKNDGTDLHSVVAKTVNISRNSAKILNYARLYGSGQLHAGEFLRSQGASSNEAQEIAAQLFESTKGRKINYLELNTQLNAHFEEFKRAANLDEPGAKSGYLHIDGRYFLAAGYDRKLNELFEDWLRRNLSTHGVEPKGPEFHQIVYKQPQFHTLYTDGFESDTFNFLELRARAEIPRTPVLGCRLTTALEALPPQLPDAETFTLRYKRTIINWLVQSSAVDYLHMLLVCMRWMCDELNIEARFVISVHDEVSEQAADDQNAELQVRYLVPERDQYRAAIALNVSNMLVRAAISEKLGIRELPMSIAFFSQVDIDTILRKEVNLKCVMPDGKEVPDGEAVTMKELLEMEDRAEDPVQLLPTDLTFCPRSDLNRLFLHDCTFGSNLRQICSIIVVVVCGKR
ncbi:Mitochondrial DNA polymerase catalytic subunit [Aphelenchoides fujianensis]|nr:Mitochondrial DNA polymerase catalytic subunit [Aphelenchoides fujianensis]